MFEVLKESKSSYRIVSVFDKHGDECITFLPDEDITFILLFRGTNEPKKFKEILSEWHSFIGQTIIDTCNDVETEDMCTFVEFIIRRNHQIIFEPDDILLKDISEAI